jgi:hypothetical protein
MHARRDGCCRFRAMGDPFRRVVEILAHLFAGHPTPQIAEP